MPENKPRFIPKPGTPTPSESNAYPYYGTGVSAEARLTNVGVVNPELYSSSLKGLCRFNESQLAESKLRVKTDQLSSQLEQQCLRDRELYGYSDDTESVCSDTPSTRWQFSETKMKYTGSLDGAKRDYFELEDIDHRTDMGPVMDPIKGYCYLCTTLEEHRQHLKSEKKMRGSPLKPYNNPVDAFSLPIKPFVGAEAEVAGHVISENQARYKVVVKTGNQVNGGTDAQVTLRMFGSTKKQKTSKMVLKKPGAKFMFMRDSINTFSLTAENFPEITSIAVETDGQEKSQSWHLDYVDITNMKTGRYYHFPCNDWLSLYVGDGNLVKQLTPADKEDVYREYEVTVVTGSHKHSGTDSKVYLTLIGSQGHRSKKQLLSRKDGHSFQRGAVDMFPLVVKDIGTLSKIRIEHDNKGKSKRWLLLIIHIRDLYNGRKHLFYCNQWLIKEEGNAVWREIPASKVPKGFDLGSWGGKADDDGGDVLYEVNVHTGDVNFAGTDANIRIQMYGDKCHSKSINLSEIRGNYDDPFEKNQIDIFQVKAVNVGDLTKLKIGHDNKGVAAGWFLEKVLVRKFVDVRKRVPVEPDKMADKKKEKQTKELTSSETSDTSSESESDDETKSYVIGRNQTASRSEKKKKSKRSKKKAKDQRRVDSEIRSVTRSKILDVAISDSDKDVDESEILSSDSDDELEGSATDLRSDSSLKKRKKAKQEHRRRRMDNLSDVAEISEVSSTNTSLWDSEETPAMDRRISEALRLKQEHDRLAKTMEKVVPMVEEYTFVCKQWFAESEGDGKIERILRVTDKKVFNRR